MRLTALFSSLLLLTLFPSVNALDVNDVKTVEVWQISDMDGEVYTFASHAKNPESMTEEDKVRIRAAITDNSRMPLLPRRISSGKTQTKGMTLTVGRTRETSDTPDEATAIAKAEYKAGGEDLLMGFRDKHIDTYVLVGEKVAQVYTIHRNVKCEDGGFLVTLIGTRNSPIGVTTSSFSGSAKRIK